MNPIINYTIYQIRHKTNTHCYIGATRHYKSRIAVHKTHLLNEKKSHLYNTMQLNGGWNEYDFIVLEEYQCQSRRDAEQRESYWIQRYEGEIQLLNTYKRNIGSIPENTKCKSYYNHREHNMQIGRSYYYKHREDVLKNRKEQYAEMKRMSVANPLTA